LGFGSTDLLGRFARWLFPKVKETDEAYRLTREAQRQRNARIEELRTKYPIGSTALYLGRELVVTGHSRLQTELYWGFTIWPALHANYADDTGVIHSITLDEAELVAVRPNAELTGPRGPR
jgi:hypothetical protein